MEFNERIAIHFGGVENAVMIHNLWFWVRKNKANNRHFYEGKYWMYNSLSAFCELFPFWTLKQVRRILDGCEKTGAIEKANFNNSGYNRTIWYTVSEEVNAVYVSENLHLPKRADAFAQTGISISPNGQMDVPKRANGFAQTGKCITDNKPDINHIVNTDRESALNFLKRTSLSRYESDVLMKYQTALGADFASFETSFNQTAEIECENNKLPWTANALLARAAKYADTWIRNNKTRVMQGNAVMQNTSPAGNRIELKKRG